MDSRKLQGGWSVLGVVLVVLGSLPSRAETTLWLVRPLYPGQETLVARTEAALDKLMPGEARKDAIIGAKELAGALKSRRVDELPCFGADDALRRPHRSVLRQPGLRANRPHPGRPGRGGLQVPGLGLRAEDGQGDARERERIQASRRRCLGAVAKVVPAASTLDVKSTPPGATVYVDDVKVGVTPLITQVLPGRACGAPRLEAAPARRRHGRSSRFAAPRPWSRRWRR